MTDRLEFLRTVTPFHRLPDEVLLEVAADLLLKRMVRIG